MTRKDFVLIARVLKDQLAELGEDRDTTRARIVVSTLRETADRFTDELVETNPNFDRERFLTACGF